MKGAFLVGLTTTGIKMLVLHPPDLLPKHLQDEFAKKSMPIGAEEGDFITVVMEGYQAATMMMKVDSFEQEDTRSTMLGLGVILHEADNPTMYRKMLKQIIDHYQRKNMLQHENLIELPKLMIEAFKRPRFQLKLSDGDEITIELEGGITEGQRIREALKRLR